MDDHMHRVGALAVSCPICGTAMAIDIYAGMEKKEDGTYYVTTSSDVADLWAHSFMHKEGKI